MLYYLTMLYKTSIIGLQEAICVPHANYKKEVFKCFVRSVMLCWMMMRNSAIDAGVKQWIGIAEIVVPV